MGNLTFTSAHYDGTTSGETTNHANVGVTHMTNTFTGGRYTSESSSQNGMDGIVYKISNTGVPQAIYAINTESSDGLYTNSENGGSNGYNYMYSISPFASGTHIAVAGNFRGNLTCPVGASGSTVLTNRKSGSCERHANSNPTLACRAIASVSRTAGPMRVPRPLLARR